MNLKQNRSNIVFRISRIFILIGFIFFTNDAAFSKTMILTFASIGPQKKGYIGNAEHQFFDEIKKQTDGKLLIRRFHNISFKTNETLDQVRSGKVAFGAINIAYYPKRLMLNSAIYLFQRGPTQYENIMWIYDRIYEELPVLNDEIKQFNQKTIYRFANLPTAVFFNKPVHSIEDFKGKRIRCTSRWDVEILKGIGAVPIKIPVNSLYTAFKTNAIEGIMTSISGQLQKYKDINMNIFTSRELWTPRPLQITVNLDIWNRLPKELQKGIEVAAKNAREKMAENYLKSLELSIAKHKELGRNNVFAGDKDINTWMQRPETRLILNQWKAEAENAGYQDAHFLLEKIQTIIHEGIKRDN